jgi:Arm DNA-binding domain
LDTVFVPRLFFKVKDGIAMALTTIGITNLRPKKADYRVADGGGLYIRVRPNGSKLWRYDYRLDGSRRTHSIGEWGGGSNRVSLKQARDAHDEARAAVARGEHPIGQKFAAALAEIEKASRKTAKEATEGWECSERDGEGIVQTTNEPKARTRPGEAAKAVDGTKIRRAERPVPVRLRPPAPNCERTPKTF